MSVDWELVDAIIIFVPKRRTPGKIFRVTITRRRHRNLVRRRSREQTRRNSRRSAVADADAAGVKCDDDDDDDALLLLTAKGKMIPIWANKSLVLVCLE